MLVVDTGCWWWVLDARCSVSDETHYWCSRPHRVVARSRGRQSPSAEAHGQRRYLLRSWDSQAAQHSGSFTNESDRLRAPAARPFKADISCEIQACANSQQPADEPASSIQRPASSIQHRASSIEHPASSIQHPASSIQYPVTSIPPFHSSTPTSSAPSAHAPSCCRSLSAFRHPL